MTHQGFNTLSPALQAVALPAWSRFNLVRGKTIGFTPNTFEWANTTRRRWHKKLVASGYYARKAKEWRAKKKPETGKLKPEMRGRARALTPPVKQQRKSTRSRKCAERQVSGLRSQV